MAALVICAPMGGALLAKVYGLASMKQTTLFFALPCLLALIFMWFWAQKSGRNYLSSALAIGGLGGLLATICYDLVRVPFVFRGQRIFAPISAYGIWILDSHTSSRFTEITGWAYHISNGITFGIMYALFMRKRFWAWAVLWAFALETIAIISPFARIFHLSGNYQAIAIAYFGHLAYGLPLGWMVFNWEKTRAWMARYSLPLKATVAAAFVIAVVWFLSIPGVINRNARAQAGEFRVESIWLNPDWLRLDQKGEIQIYNPESEPVTVRVRQTHEVAEISGNQKATLSFPEPGIYQVFVETYDRTQSSFVIVEPVGEVK